MAKQNFTLRVVAAQLNFLVGDISGNAQKIIAHALRARDDFNADIVVFPEMALTGYPPEDLLLRHELYDRVNLALENIKQQVQDIYIIVGYPEKNGSGYFNTAGLIYNGKIIANYRKHQLPNYGVFDEKRYFIPGDKPNIVQIKNIRVAVSVCEDMWFPYQMAEAKLQGAQLMISINASPFDIQKPFVREKIMRDRAIEGNMPIIYVNCVGGQDELIFDGGSMVMNASGEVTQRTVFFAETLIPIDLEINTKGKVIPKQYKTLPISSIEERVYQALVLGVRDYIEKNHFKGAIIGLSGGVDSALTLAIAVDAIGKDRVEALYMPSRYSSPLSAEIAAEEAKLLGVKYSEISIEPIFAAYLESLAEEFKCLLPDITEENLQARIRGTLLMAFSNKKKLIVLSTGNKSENAVGYATLYGDMVGGFCVLKDVFKTLVYSLCAYRNTLSQVIPQSVIDRPPSAELAKDQKDTDSLPPYPILDGILERYIELDQSREEIIAAGFEPTIVEKVVGMVNRNEYKRRQAPPGIRITMRAFGRDRRYPITSGF